MFHSFILVRVFKCNLTCYIVISTTPPFDFSPPFVLFPTVFFKFRTIIHTIYLVIDDGLQREREMSFTYNESRVKVSESKSIAGCCRKRGVGCGGDKHAHNVNRDYMSSNNEMKNKWNWSKQQQKKTRTSRAHLSLENCTIFVVGMIKTVITLSLFHFILSLLPSILYLVNKNAPRSPNNNNSTR